MTQIRKIWTSKFTNDINEYVGRDGEIFYASGELELRFSDGVTPGGLPFTPGGGGSGTTGPAGPAGPAGPSGVSGFSGVSGQRGPTGTSSFSGFSGISGFSGWSGSQGYSGIIGYSGQSGYSGMAGSGQQGESGYSGFSGFSGEIGQSGISGYSGSAGAAGVDGVSGASGYSGAGTSGFSGYSGAGASGLSGYSGADGLPGASGFSGYSGLLGPTGAFSNVQNDVSTNADRYIVLASSTGPLATSYISNTKLIFNPSDGILSAVDYNSLSDQKYKTNIQPIDNAAVIINQLRPVSFTWAENGKVGYGVIAQEIEQILPEVVENSVLGKTVGYLKLIPFLIQSLQEMQVEIANLKKQNDGK